MTSDEAPREPEWVQQARIGAEIAVAVGTSVLTVLDALERHRALNTEPQVDPSLLPVPNHPEEMEAP